MGKKYRLMAVLLTGFALAAAGCGRAEEAAQESQTSETSDILTQAAETADTFSADLYEEAGVQTDAAPQVSIYPAEKDWYNDDGSVWLLHADYNTISVHGDVAPALIEAVSSWSRENEEAIFNYGDEVALYAAEDASMSENANADYYFYDIYNRLETARSDSRVLSFYQFDSEYTGGAHGNYAYTGVNFDVRTGELLKLENVLKDAGGFRRAAVGYITEELKRKYDAGLFPEYENTVEKMWENDPVWYLDAAGITFIFNPYEVGPFAMGEARVTLPYAEFGEYLEPEYLLPEGGEMLARLPENDEIFVNLAGTSSVLDRISVMTEWKDEYSDAQITLKVNDVITQVGTFARIGDAYYMELEDGRKFVILDADYASDDFVTFVYEVTGGTVTERSRLEGVSLSGGDINTEVMTLSMHLDVLGTYGGWMDYVINETGELCPTEEFYRISVTDSPYHLLTAIRDIPVTMDSGEETTLPAGTSLWITGTDNNGTVLFRLQDSGKEGRIHYVRGDDADDQWGIYIDGVSEYEYFESLPYAG